jgi:hypothetical protein
LPVTRRRSGTAIPYACASRALASRSPTNSISTRLATVSLVGLTEIQVHRLRDRRAQRQPARARTPAQTGDQRRRQPNREHCRALRHHDWLRALQGLVHVPTRLPLRESMLALQRTHRVRRRRVDQQLDRAIDANRVLVGISSAAGHQPLAYHASRPNPPRRPRNRPLKLEVRDCVGAVISPVLANLFLHYALDMWLVREFPDVPFERYADDVILHCTTKAQAQVLRDAIIERLAQVGLELNLDKTRIVYCKDANRKGSREHEQFTFLSYTFRPRLARSKAGVKFVSFLPAVSDDAAKDLRRKIKRWRLHLWSGRHLADLAQEINSTVRGWIGYYGRYYRTELIQTLKLINDYLVRWAMRKYKRLRRHPTRATRFLAAVAKREPRLFVHWAWGVQPSAG